ncbi:hypothetical protein DFA_04353 [Cavenderia fasciculata]|uniref:Ankyrin repeat-containing protein n=1 Tax=Cavenderia fasciculata TaxID=261658 RepID=F4PPC2_CACFS|nr:uncharacterized protein DFA_04353 [Cavenderia fasciculata]EGG22235.1 hypothetical protein DFA_04353 [Cavenderia fasciculata]|eukprot:XP_004360086.1 hypothetical protein DFA_04353 [Cavenderia fasciculata]
MTTTTNTTPTTFHCIFKVKYIRQLIFNHISCGRKQQQQQQWSLKGVDIIKLPYLGMISKFAMPWYFVCHYLPSNSNQILLERRKRVITQYCCHQNAAFDTLLHLLKWSPDVGFDFDYDLMYVNAPNMNQDIIEYIIKGLIDSSNSNSNNLKMVLDWATQVICRNGYLSTLKMLNSKGVDLKYLPMDICSSFEMVKYLHDNRIGSCSKDAMFLHFNRTEGATKKAMDNAATNGYLEIVQFLHEHRSEGATTNAMDYAAENGHIEIVKFLSDHRSEGATTYAMNKASMNGHIEIIKYLHEHRSEGATAIAMDYASKNGHIEIVKFLSEHRSEGATTYAMDWASMKGHIQIVEYLHFNRTEGATTNAMDWAAEYNHIEILKFLYENRTEGCSSFCILFPATKGYIDIISYLAHTVKVPLQTKLVRTVLLNGQLDIFYFLRDHFADHDSIWNKGIMDAAASKGYIEVVKYLHEHRSEGATTYAMDHAAEKGHLEMIKYLHFNRTEGATKSAMDLAAENGYIDIVKFLHFNRSEGCTKRAVENACWNGHLEIAEFLINVRKEKYDKEEIIKQQSTNDGYYDIVRFVLSHEMVTGGLDKLGKQSLEALIYRMKNHSNCFEIVKLLEIYLEHGVCPSLERLGDYTDTLNKTSMTHKNNNNKKKYVGRRTLAEICLHLKKLQYIRHLIFNQVGVIQKQLYRGSDRGRLRPPRSLKGRDITKLHNLEMISKFAMPWNYIRHYLPLDDCTLLLFETRKRVISEYCYHQNATLDTLEHLWEWSHDVDFNWEVLSKRCDGIPNQEILEFIIKKCPAGENKDFFRAAINMACRNGYLEIIKMIDSIKGIKIKKKAMDTASSMGFIDIFLHFNRTEVCTTDAMDFAAGNGYFEMVKFLHEHRSEGATTKAMNWAARNGFINIVKYLAEHRSEGATTDAIDGAAENGHIDVIRYLQEHRSEGATSNAMDWAAENGHIDVIRYLHFNRTEGASTNAMDGAAEKGYIEVVKFLQEHRSEGATTSAMDRAAGNGHIEVVKYLSEHRSEGATTDALDNASKNGHIEMVKFLYNIHRTEGTTSDALCNAASNGHIEIIKFLCQHFNASKSEMELVMELASQNNRLEVVKFLYFNQTVERFSLEFNFERVVLDACRNGFLDMLSFFMSVAAVKDRCNGEEMLTAASTRGQCDTVKLILEQFGDHLDKESLERMTATTTTITTTYTFHCIFRVSYIRHLIFKKIGVISKHLLEDEDDYGYRRLLPSLKGRDIIKLPYLGMISKYAMSWDYIRHYLPKDCNQVLLERRKRAISEYCCHPNATFNTLEHLLKWSKGTIGFDFDWIYFQRKNKVITNKEILEYLINIKKCSPSTTTRNNNSNSNYLLVDAMELACKTGDLSLLKLCSTEKNNNNNNIRSRGTKQLNTTLMNMACGRGSIDIVKYLHDNNLTEGGCTVQAMDQAADNNQLEILKFLHFNRTEGCSSDALENAARNGHLEIVKFLHEHRTEGCYKDAISRASIDGHIDVVQFIHEHRSDGATTYAMDGAAKNGHIEVVKFLHFNRTEGASTDAIDLAAENGHIEIVKFLSEYRSEGATTTAMDYAASNGHIEIVKYLSEHRSEGATTKAMDYAAGNGYIEVVKFLHEHRSEGATTDAMNDASMNGKIDVVKFLHEHRSEGATTDAMDDASMNGHIDVVKFLHEHRSEGATTGAITSASTNGHIDVVEFLHFNRSEGATTNAMDEAAGNNHIEIVKLLHFNRSEGCSNRAIRLACHRGQLETASFLIDVRKEKCGDGEKILQAAAHDGHYDLAKLILQQFRDTLGTEPIKRILTFIKDRDHFEITQLLVDHIKLSL